jgi:hypothetical protein
VPVVIQYSYDFAIQISNFLEMPLAVFYIEPGDGGDTGDYIEYYQLIHSMKVIFGWYTPDDNMIREGQVPVPLKFPLTDPDEHVQGIYKTGLNDGSLMRSYAWRDLPNVDKAVAHFAFNINFFHKDLEVMMTRSKALKDEIAAGATWSEKPSGMPGIGSQDFKGSWADLGFDQEPWMLTDALVGRIVACEWVRNYTEKWLHWLPARCGPGTLANSAMTSCEGCTAGYFCPGYNSTSQGGELCPVGHFCPANSSEPQQCDRGRTSPRGASAEADCQCSASSVWISNRCRPVVDFLLPVVIVPICVVLALLFAVHLFVKRRSIKVDAYEELIRLRTIELRERLQITRQHGYILSTDKLMTLSRSRYVIIPKLLLDSAVRLMMLEDFDLDAFDAFCVLVANTDYDAVSSVFGDRMGDSHTPVRADIPFGSASKYHIPSGSAPNETGTPSEDKEGSFLRRRRSSGINNKVETKSLPHMKLLRQWLLELASTTLAEISFGNQTELNEMMKLRTRKFSSFRGDWGTLPERDKSRRQLYRYFSSKMLKARIFRDDSCSLFVELKQHIQVLMNKLAGVSNARVRDMLSEPGGSDLCTLVFVPGMGIKLGRSKDEGLTAELPCLRQDDARVGAVRMGPSDELELKVETTLPNQHVNEFGVRMLYSDSVSIAQLHRRALLVDRAFKAKVIEAFTFQQPQPSDGVEKHKDTDSDKEEGGKSSSGGGGGGGGHPK